MVTTKAKPAAPKGRTIPRGFSLNQKGLSAAPSLGLFGRGGTGKTLALVGPLLAGEKLVGASSDFGGDGLDTVIGHMQHLGKGELLENLLNVNLTDWNDIAAFARDPRPFFSDFDLDAWGPTVVFLEGYSSAQLISLEEELVKDDMGLPEQRDWNKVKRNTLRVLVRLKDLQIGDKPQAKIVTFLENTKEDDQSKVVTGPLIQGAARDLMMPAFDLMVRTHKSKDGKYHYTFRGPTEKLNVKSRERRGVPDEVEADPLQLWKALRDPGYKWEVKK